MVVAPTHFYKEEKQTNRGALSAFRYEVVRDHAREVVSTRKLAKRNDHDLDCRYHDLQGVSHVRDHQVLTDPISGLECVVISQGKYVARLVVLKKDVKPRSIF